MPTADGTRHAGTDEEAVPFEEAAAVVLGGVQSAFSDLIRALPGEIRRASDLQKALTLDTKLGWQVFKVAHAPTPMRAGTSIPKAVSVRRLVKAARLHVSPDIIERIERAFARFERLVHRHAGDRASFDSMLSAISREGSQAIDLEHKRAAFRAQSHIWGVHARASLLCHIFRVAEQDSARLDSVSIRGMYDLVRLRRDAPWIVSNTRVSDDDGVVRGAIAREPIDPHEDRHGVSLLRDFCSQPLPTFSAIPAGGGFTNIQLEGNSIGNTASVTCIMADVYRNVFSRYRDEHNAKQRTQKMIRTPTETHIHDVLIPRGIFRSRQPRVMMYGDHRNVDPALPGRECDLLPLHETVDYLGCGTNVLYTPHVPRYPEMAEYILKRLGWDQEEFEVYRCRVEYPVMPSSVVVEFDLQDAP